MYGVKTAKDGLEKFLPMLNLCGAGVGVLFFPADLFLLESNHVTVRGFLASRYLAVNIGWATYATIFAQLNVGTLLFLIYLTVLHLNDTQLWLEHLK